MRAGKKKGKLRLNCADGGYIQARHPTLRRSAGSLPLPAPALQAPSPQLRHINLRPMGQPKPTPLRPSSWIGIRG